MRPDLALTATVSGEPMEFIARDVPTGVFFLGFEDTFPGAECFARLTPKQQRDNVLGFEAWADALLCRAMLEPRLTPELIQRLGSARDELAVGYLWGVGYHTPSLKEREQLVPPQAMDGPSQARHTWREDYAALIAVPPPNIKLAIRDLGRLQTMKAVSSMRFQRGLTEFPFFREFGAVLLPIGFSLL